MIKYTRDELENLIQSDCEYGDLTTSLTKSQGKASMKIISRDDITLSHIDAVEQIASFENLDFKSAFKNSQKVKAGDEVLELSGDFISLHRIYKMVQNLLEYSCGISTNAANMKKLAKEVNTKCEILVTRKNIPFAKKMCLKAALEGGAKIHRIATFDSILFFDTHLSAFSSKEEFLSKADEFKNEFCEKKIMAEAKDLEFAKQILEAGFSGVQTDKMSVSDVANLVKFKNENYPNAVVLAAGGINIKNVQDYAKTMVNGIVTTWPYRGMADLGTKIKLL